MNLWENSTELDKVQLEVTAKSQMKITARNCITQAMTECMGKGDWVVLNILGIDARKMFLEIFKQELVNILNECHGQEPREEE